MSEESIVWINGSLVPHDEVGLSPFDLGVSVGLGVFETLIAYQGVMPTLQLHVDRFTSAASSMKMDVPEIEQINEAIQNVIKVNNLGKKKRVRVRITLGAGEHALTAKNISRGVENYLIISAVPQSAPAPLAELAVVPMRCNEYSALASIKSGSYAENIMAYRSAARAGADEAVMLNTSGNLCECSMSNIFLVKGEKILTPPLSSGCLPGVTRMMVIECCTENGMPIEEGDLTEDDLFSADEIFITSSAREVQPARMVDISAPCPGSVTLRVVALYQEFLKEEIDYELK